LPKPAAGPDLSLYRRVALGIGLLMFAVARPVSTPRPVDECADRQEDETRDNEEYGEHHDASVPRSPRGFQFSTTCSSSIGIQPSRASSS
jgi:hypothetical protein